MRAVPHLAQLARVSTHRLGRLQYLLVRHVDAGRAATDVAVANRVTAFVAIEALNLWAQFVRSFYISCATQTHTGAGLRVALRAGQAPSYEDAITRAIKTLMPGKKKKNPPWGPLDEPSWRLQNILIDLDSAMGFSNTSQILAGLSYPTSVLAHLPAFRNFFCHRCQGTAAEALALARSLGVGPRLRPEEMLRSVPKGPISIIGLWVVDLGQMIEIMCS
jgi:hypothetical protein